MDNNVTSVCNSVTSVYNSVTSVCNSVTSVYKCNISPFQPVLVFFHHIEEMLRTKVMDDGYMCGQTSMLLFSWNGIMLQTDVTHCSYIPKQLFALCAFITKHTCYEMRLRYRVTLYVCTRF